MMSQFFVKTNQNTIVIHPDYARTFHQTGLCSDSGPIYFDFELQSNLLGKSEYTFEGNIQGNGGIGVNGSFNITEILLRLQQ